MMKRLLSVILVVVLCLGAFPLSTAAAPDRASFDVGDNEMWEVEYNDDISYADRIYSDYTIWGDVYGDDVDCFKFVLTSNSYVEFVAVGSNSHMIVGVANNESVLDASYLTYYDGNYIAATYATMSAGTYYILVLNEEGGSYYNDYLLYINWSNSSHTHNYTSRVTPATCTNGGYTTYTCSCGYSYTSNATSALGHNYTTSQVDPTCVEDGGNLHSCTRCSDKYLTEIIPAYGHSYTEESGVFCATCGEVDSGVTYPDIKRGQWYYNAVHYVTLCGFMKGYQSGKFGPADNLQRQDFVVALARIAGADLTPYMDSTGGLKDVVKGAYYAPAVAWAVDQGIITGYQNGKFGVGDTVTREQVATIFYRYVGSPEIENIDEILSAYPDYRRVSVFAEAAMAWAVQNGVITGTNGTLSPTTGASRAMIATIMMRMNEAGMFDPAPEEDPVDPEEPVDPVEPVVPAA